MQTWGALTAELHESRVLPLSIALLAMLAAVRVLAPAERVRVKGAVVLFSLYLLLLPAAAALRVYGSTFYRETHLVALVFATLAMILIAGTLLLNGIAPRIGLGPSRILQDVLIAGASAVALFSLASHAGLNLSGLVATSAVLTAVIGLAFQDTLGNIVTGLALQLDKSIRIGDWIKVGDVSGRVTEIRWRYTAIETRNWETMILPNSLLVKGQVLVLGRRAGEPPLWRRWVWFNVDFRFSPHEVIEAVNAAIQSAPIENVATNPAPHCILMDLHESYGRYAVRYWLIDMARDDPTDSVVRTRIYFALRRVQIPLSMPAQALFVTTDTSERRAQKSQQDLQRRLGALARIDLFSALSDEEREQLADGLRVAPFARGETITRQGRDAHWLYIIAEGEAVVKVSAPDGPDREVARLQAGQFFGEMSLLTGAPRSATVVAGTDVECFRLDRATFQRLLDRRPEIAEHVAEVLAKRRVELAGVRDNLDQDAQNRRLRDTQTDLLGKIRRFFAMEEN
jgi:small-conductance mechanosensitive channel/CRP-like cAMP-binding protein